MKLYADDSVIGLANKAKRDHGIPRWKTIGHGLAAFALVPAVGVFSLAGQGIKASGIGFWDQVIAWMVLIYLFYRVLRIGWKWLERTDPTSTQKLLRSARKDDRDTR